MFILALDQSTVSTGWAVFDNTSLLSYGVIDIKKYIKDNNLDKDAISKVNIMGVEIQKKINEIRPDFIVFEDVALQTNVSTLVKLANLQGIIISECLKYDVSFDIIKPTSWRKLLGFVQRQGKVRMTRKELKQQAIDYVTNNYGVTLKDDIAEAICIGSAELIKIN